MKFVKTTWEDITNKRVEHKGIDWGRYRPLHGLSSMDLWCPFCGIELEVYQWSIHGGKRCDECGAMITPQGAYKVKQ